MRCSCTRSRRRATLSRKASIVTPQRFARLVEAAHLNVDAAEYASCLIVPRPFDRLLPTLAVRLAEGVERLGSPAVRILGTQVGVAARRAA